MVRTRNGASRISVGVWYDDLSGANGRSLYGLFVAMGSDVLLGCSGYYFAVLVAIPGIGPDLAQWVRGDFLISGITLNRFFALHVVALPIVILALVVLHIIALHEVGSNNPDGIDIKQNKDEAGVPLDGIPFHPYYTVKDLVGVAVFLFVFCGSGVLFQKAAATLLKSQTLIKLTRCKRLITSRPFGI